jgi:hypothetical protein
LVLGGPITPAELDKIATERHINLSKTSVIGVVAEDTDFFNRHVLHSSGEPGNESEYLDEYAKLNSELDDRELVLPGYKYEALNLENVEEAIRKMRDMYGYQKLVFKIGEESDGNGHHTFSVTAGKEEIQKLLDEYYDPDQPKPGFVVEPYIESEGRKTLSVGEVFIAEEPFYFLAVQLDRDVNYQNGQGGIFGGGEVIVGRGALADIDSDNNKCLLRQIEELGFEEEVAKVSLKKALEFHEAYLSNGGSLDKVQRQNVRRISYDVVSGLAEREDSSGNIRRVPLAGVTDVTARAGGLGPAIFGAINSMLESGDKIGKGVCKLFYGDEMVAIAADPGNDYDLEDLEELLYGDLSQDEQVQLPGEFEGYQEQQAYMQGNGLLAVYAVA